MSFSYSADSHTGKKILVTSFILKDGKDYTPEAMHLSDGIQGRLMYPDEVFTIRKGDSVIEAKVQRVYTRSLVLDNNKGLTGTGTTELVVGKGLPNEETVAFQLPAIADMGGAPYMLTLEKSVDFKNIHNPGEFVVSPVQ